MRYGFLSQHFSGVVAKRLVSVEADFAASNQHEFNGTAALRRLLGGERIDRLVSRFVHITDDDRGIADDAPVTWYDARDRHPTRSEWRLYFKSNAAMAEAAAGDLLIVARRSSGALLFILAPRGSTTESQLVWLFAIDSAIGSEFQFESYEGKGDQSLDFVSRLILDEIGVQVEDDAGDVLDALLAPHGLTFPTSRVFSELARRHAGVPSPSDDPDRALLGWVEFEEALFRRLERKIVTARLAGGFDVDGRPDVDGFLQFSLSVQNRRKSRMGLSLENHVGYMLECMGVRHERGAVTEGRSKPDFLFPSAAAYRNPASNEDFLTMLATKSTLKDRWRQVLVEARRIRRKHLLTLEPSISTNQTDEMRSHELQLVIPKPLHATYSSDQADWLMSFGDFIEIVVDRQRRCAPE